MSTIWSGRNDSGVPDWLGSRIGIDSRGLAAFRIVLGVVLLLDLLTRLRSLRTLYTDAGVVPRSAVVAEYGSVYELVLSLPDPWFPVLVFPVAVACALALIAGYRARLAAFGSLVALVLLQMRNPFVLNGGDVLLRILVIWAVFLPLGRHSLFGEEKEPEIVVSVATVGALVQVVLVYVVNASHKLDSEAWKSGEAVAGVFRTEQYTYLLADFAGDALAGTGLLTAATYFWFGLLMLSPLLLLARGRVRAALVSLFIATHVGMFLTLSVGLFPLISITSLLLLYPSAAWNWIGEMRSRFDLPKRNVPLPSSPFAGSETTDSRFVPPGFGQGIRRLVLSGLPAVILVLSLLSAAGAVGVLDTPSATDRATETADIGQDWGMFAPNPPDTTWWIATPATHEDGSSIDAFHDRELDRTTPAHANELKSFRWRKYYEMLHSAEGGPQRSEFARYLCENRDIESVELYYGYERIDPDGGIERGGQTLLTYDCRGPAIQD